MADFCVFLQTSMVQLAVQEELIYHVNGRSIKLPIYCSDAKSIDLQFTLECIVQYPIRYIVKQETLVRINFGWLKTRNIYRILKPMHAL